MDGPAPHFFTPDRSEPLLQRKAFEEAPRSAPPIGRVFEPAFEPSIVIFAIGCALVFAVEVAYMLALNKYRVPGEDLARGPYATAAASAVSPEPIKRATVSTRETPPR